MSYLKSFLTIQFNAIFNATPEKSYKKRRKNLKKKCITYARKRLFLDTYKEL